MNHPTERKDCCEKCEQRDSFGKDDVFVEIRCANDSCPCHSQQPQNLAEQLDNSPQKKRLDGTMNQIQDNLALSSKPLFAPSRNEDWDTLTALIANDINEILEYRGIWDCGKNFEEDVQQRILPRIREQISKAREEALLNVGANFPEFAEAKRIGFKHGKQAGLREVRAQIDKLKVRHELDRELYNDSGGGVMCANCGKQGYTSDEEECDPNEINDALNELLSLLSPEDGK